MWTFTAGDGSLELAGTPLTLRLLHAGKPVLASITDRTQGRPDAATRDRPRATRTVVAGGVRAGVGRAGLRPGRADGDAEQARPAGAFAGRTGRRLAFRVGHECAVLLESRPRRRSLGRLRPHAVARAAWRRLSRLVAAFVWLGRRRRSARFVPDRRPRSRAGDRALHRADRTRTGSAALESRRVDRARRRPERRRRRRSGVGSARSPRALRRSDARRRRDPGIHGRPSISDGTREAIRRPLSRSPRSGSRDSRSASASSRRYRFTRRCSMTSRAENTC